MNNIEEIEKFKALLDQGVISKEEFLHQKQKILGLTSNKEKNSEIENITNKKILEGKENFESEQSKTNTDISEIYEIEKAKQRAKLDAEQELKDTIKKQYQDIENFNSEERDKRINEITNKILNSLKWVITIFLLILTLSAFISFNDDRNWKMIAIGIIYLLLGLMSCPSITRITTKYQKYTKYKKFIILFIFVLILLIAYI